MYKEDSEDIIRGLQKELEAARKQIELLQEKSKEFERLSITDGLTGLYNQRRFYDMLEQEVARNRRQKHSLTLLFLDVDGLKFYNDTHGHSGGDEVLKAVAQSLFMSIRENVDSGYRYGGDEFVAILPEARTEQAVEIAQRVNSCLQETDLPHVTLSFGIAELSPEMDSGTLFKHVDEAMYMAKKSTESKIHVYGE